MTRASSASTDRSGENPTSRVLVVEDNPGDARLLRAYLTGSDLGVTPDVVGTLAEAIDAVDGYDYDVAFLDLGLPDSEGVETVERLHRALVRDVPIIVLTGLNDVAVGRRSIRAGAAEYLIKDEITEQSIERTVKFVLEREQAWKARRAAEERWHQVFDRSPIPKAISEIESGRIVEVNEAFTEMFGADRSALEGASSIELGLWEDPDRRRELVAKLRVEGGFEAEEVWYRDVEGRRGRMLMSARVLELSGEGQVIWTLLDVTERYERERFLSTLLANLPGIVYRCRNDRPWTMEYLAPGIEQLTGYAAEELLGSGDPTYADLIHPEDRESVWQEVQEAVEAGRSFRLEYRIRTRKGAEKWVWEQGTAVESEREGPVALEGYLVEITEEVEARRAAAVTRERLQRVFETMREAVVIVDTNQRVQYANPAAEDVFGVPPSELAGRRSDDPRWKVLRPDGSPLDPTEFPAARVLSTGEPAEGVETVYMGPDGRRVHLSTNAAPLRDESGEVVGVVATSRDVTEQRKTEEWRHLLQSSVEAAAQGIVITDRAGEIVWVNEAFTRLTGYEHSEVIGENTRILQSGEQDEAFYEELWSTILAGETWQGEIVNRRKDGTLYTERMSIEPVRHGDDEITHFVAIKEDVTEEKERAERVRSSEAQLRAIIGTMAEALVIVDADGQLAFANERAADLFGVKTGELTRRIYNDPAWQVTAVDGGPFPEEELPFARVEAERRPVFDIEHAVRRPDGTRQVISVNAAPLWSADREFEGMIATIRDITEQRRLQDQLRHQALHDPLTGLANRALFTEQLATAVERARRHETAVAVLMLDMNRFKQVNDSLGHEAGDRLLAEVGRRLEGVVRAEDTVARWGGDEFCVLLTDLPGREALEQLRARATAVMERPYRLGGDAIRVDWTIGAVFFDPDDAGGGVTLTSPEELVRYADYAMRRGKERPGSTFHVYRPSEIGDAGASTQLQREQELRRAIEAAEFVVHYQPIVRLEDGRIWGVEPLVRWRHPGRGLVGPDVFIGLAEETGLILEIGRQVMRDAFERVRAWNEGRSEPIHCCLNVSARQFEDESFTGQVAECLSETGLEPSWCHLEITETALMRATHRLSEIRDQGLRILVDDFGTGYSSLLYLRDLPVDGLKIDQAFVGGLGTDSDDRAIVESVLTLGRSTGRDIIAEGVETIEQRDVLRDLGCGLAQGFFFAEPMPADELTPLLDRALPLGETG